MAFDFWQAQKKARSRTNLYVGLFLLLTLSVACGLELVMRNMAPGSYDPPLPYMGLFFAGVTFIVTLFQLSMYKQFGGSYVAKSLGGIEVDATHPHPKVRQYVNIVEEISIASGMPMPKVFVLPAHEINAFAAGLTNDNAAVAVTEGALQLLNRDELQGVVAHEFGHIYNGDMRITLQLAAMVMGFFIIFYLGLRILQFAGLTGAGNRYSDESSSSDNRRGGANPVVLAAIAFIVAGAVTWFFGSLLKAAVSRQREFLADACAVQFTRNPHGISRALQRIASETQYDMPRSGMAFSHMYISDRQGCTSLFDTHPPLEKRIAAIEGLRYLPEEWKRQLDKENTSAPR